MLPYRLLMSGLLLLGACAEPREAHVDDSGALPPLTDRAAWRARVGWTEECEQAHRDDPAAEGSGVQTYPVGERRHLVEVECSRGAYQTSFNYVLYDLGSTRARATLLRFPAHDGERWSLEPEVAGTPSFIPEAPALEVLSKARGAGDCGQLVHYGFATDGPKLLWVRARDCAEGSGEGAVPPPEEWPLVPPSSLPTQ